ncbi:MAG: hypothetical protein ACK5PB_15675 [Pirellula sp.]
MKKSMDQEIDRTRFPVSQSKRSSRQACNSTDTVIAPASMAITW